MDYDLFSPIWVGDETEAFIQVHLDVALRRKKAGRLIMDNSCLPHPLLPHPAHVAQEDWIRMTLLDAVNKQTNPQEIFGRLRDKDPDLDMLSEVWYKEVNLFALVLPEGEYAND